MSEWAAVVIVAILCTYKLIDRWFDTREEEAEHHSVYSDTERHERDGVRDDSERAIPDVQLGFIRETR